jgi:antitoxin component YwqK of YwqJK toxin-antitoxin module
MKNILTILSFFLIQQIALSQQFDTCDITLRDTQGLDIVYFKYYCDNELCNGNMISFWNNGKIHFQGSFRDGYPIDLFKQFDQNGNIVVWKFIDSLGITWHYDKCGNLLYSSTKHDEIRGGGFPNEKVFYGSNGIKVKKVYETTHPTSWKMTTTYYDSLGNEKFIVSTEFSFLHLIKAKHFKKLSALLGAKYYEVQFVDQSKLLLINQDYYKSPPLGSSEIVQESIIYEFIIRKGILFIYDKNKDRYIRLIKINSA